MSLWGVRIFLILISLSVVSLVAAYVLFKCRSDKRGFFVLALFSTSILVLGSLLEAISVNTSEALTAVRVFYLGGGLCVLFFIFFYADYCDIRLPRIIRVLLAAITLLYIIAVWTSDTTGLFFSSITPSQDGSYCLTYAPGRISVYFQLYYIVYAAISFILIIKKITISQGNVRKSLTLCTIAMLLPLLARAIEDFSKLFSTETSSTTVNVLIYAISSIIYYIAIKKFDMLDNSPVSFSRALDTISHAVVILDEKQRFVSANEAARKLFPWLSEQTRLGAIYDSPDWPAELSESVFSDGEFSTDFEMGNCDRHFHVTGRPFKADISHRNHWFVMIQDVTESEHFIKRLEEAAYTDTLTGLYNRRHFAEIATPFIERARRSDSPYYVMMADLDFFKNINDMHGHLAGDAVLQHAANIMKSSMRSYDIVARWGGEEFIFLITDSDVEHVLALAERIRSAFETSICVNDGEKLPITISLGVVQSDSESNDITKLILRADEALYKAKQDGRNRVVLWSADE